MSAHDTVFLTGATGLVGGDTLARLLRAEPGLRAVALVRDLARWTEVAARLGPLADRATPVVGDVQRPGLGLDASTRRRLAGEITGIVHAAADVVFSSPLDAARATNVDGTRHALELADAWPLTRRFAYVSTAFVAGRRTGRVLERDNGTAYAWVNAYQQSKYEAESLVRASAPGWLILRPSMIVCDTADGVVSQFNAVHYTLHLWHQGLAPMIPGTARTTADAVPRDFVSAAVAALALRDDVAGETLHLCAGAGALALDELIAITWDAWSASAAWRGKAIPRPALVDLETYRRFERTVEETADENLRRVTRSLGSFAPELALPKDFDTARADALLGRHAPPVRAFWGAMVRHLVDTDWALSRRRAA